MATNNDDDPRQPLLTARAALVLLFSLLSGIAVPQSSQRSLGAPDMRRP
jgi:hypothetical protein